MTGLWRNSPYLSWWGRRYADGAIVGECYLYRLYAPQSGFAAVKFDVDLDGRMFYPCPAGI